jgi:signal transduction histidine kinase
MQLGSVIQLFPGSKRATELGDVPARDAERLLKAISDLSRLRDLEGVMKVVRVAARDLSGADGVTFVLPEGDLVHYADEEAVGPLWKGRRFPKSACISGYAMTHHETVVIEDIFVDSRIPQDAYRPTFVKSLAMVPIRPDDPLGAIGAYWATQHLASDRELSLLEALAGATAVALKNAQLYDEARRGARARDEFVGVVAHELRTPLTPIRLHLDLLANGLASDADLKKAQGDIARLKDEIDGLVRMADHLIEVSELTSAAPELERSSVDLVEVVKGVVAEFTRGDCKAAIAVTAPGPVVGSWDRHRIEQVVTNLFSNAVKYGEGRPIEVAISMDASRAALAVRDHGKGILPEDQAKIFERFERIGSARSYGGFGVGLWFATRIVEAHGGTIGVKSRPGAGSTFTVLLPR